MSELKPCPFCGSAAYEDAEFGRDWWIQCSNMDCGTTTGRTFSSSSEAKEAWNTRTPASEGEQK